MVSEKIEVEAKNLEPLKVLRVQIREEIRKVVPTKGHRDVEVSFPIDSIQEKTTKRKREEQVVLEKFLQIMENMTDQEVHKASSSNGNFQIYL